MNKVIISGNLCQDVELKQTQGGKSVVSNCVAVQREYKNANGEYDSDFITIVVWDKQAEYLSRYGSKGDRVELVGRWMVRKYQAADGSTRTVNECVVESIRVFAKPKEEPAKGNLYTPYSQQKAEFEEIPTDLDLPF